MMEGVDSMATKNITGTGPLTQGADMICGGCRIERVTPQDWSYTLHYGTELRKETRPVSGGTAYIAHYKIAGSEHGILCQKCVADYKLDRLERDMRITSIAYIIVLLIFIPAIIYIIKESLEAGLAFLAILVFVLIIGGLSYWFMRRKHRKIESGDRKSLASSEEEICRLAISKRRHHQDLRNYDAFFTPEEYGNLRHTFI
jgi:hypothetical protein